MNGTHTSLWARLSKSCHGFLPWAGAGFQNQENVAPSPSPTKRPRPAWMQLTLRYRLPIVVFAHSLAFSVIYWLAYLVRFDGAIPASAIELALKTVPFVVGMKILAFWLMGSYRGWWRYATFADIVGLAEAITLASTAVVKVNYFLHSGTPIPRSIIIMDWGVTMILIGGLRGSTRLFRERYYPMIAPRRPVRVLVVGASEAGVALVRSIQGQEGLNMKVVGFLDS